MKLGRRALLRPRSLGTLEEGEATTTVVDEGYGSMPTPVGAGGWPENREERLALEPRRYGFAGCLEADQEHAPETQHSWAAIEEDANEKLSGASDADWASAWLLARLSGDRSGGVGEWARAPFFSESLADRPGGRIDPVRLTAITCGAPIETKQSGSSIGDRLIDQRPQPRVVVQPIRGDQLGQVCHDKSLLRVRPIG